MDHRFYTASDPSFTLSGTVQNKTPTAQTSTYVTHAQLLTLHLSASRDRYTIAIIYGLHCAKQCGTAASITINNLFQVRHTYALQSCDAYYQQFYRSSVIWIIFQYLIFMDPCIVVRLSRNTNKMQLCNRIYYSKVYWRLNMFRAAYRSSSGALNCIFRLWFIYPCGDRLLSRLSGTHPWQRPDTTWVYKPDAADTV